MLLAGGFLASLYGIRSFRASRPSTLCETCGLYLGGVGFRFNIAPKLKFRTGIDVARGPEEWAIYLQFGHAWGM